jgi:hypothetical protein
MSKMTIGEEWCKMKSGKLSYSSPVIWYFRIKFSYQIERSDT